MTVQFWYRAELAVKDAALTDRNIRLLRAVTKGDLQGSVGKDTPFLLYGNPSFPGDYLEGRTRSDAQPDTVIPRADEERASTGTGSRGGRCLKTGRQEAGIDVSTTDIDQERFCFRSKAAVRVELPGMRDLPPWGRFIRR